MALSRYFRWINMRTHLSRRAVIDISLLIFSIIILISLNPDTSSFISQRAWIPPAKQKTLQVLRSNILHAYQGVRKVFVTQETRNLVLFSVIREKGRWIGAQKSPATYLGVASTWLRIPHYEPQVYMQYPGASALILVNVTVYILWCFVPARFMVQHFECSRNTVYRLQYKNILQFAVLNILGVNPAGTVKVASAGYFVWQYSIC